MTGDIKPGLFRLFLKKKIRFFKIHRSTQGYWKLTEYDKGDLHQKISEKKGVTLKLWSKLTTWQ